MEATNTPAVTLNQPVTSAGAAGNPLAALMANVSKNPAQVEFPADKWGFTSQVRKAVLAAASTIRGQDDKHELLLGTLAVLAAHIKARLPGDKAAAAAARIEAIKAADQVQALTRQYGEPVNPAEDQERAIALLKSQGFNVSKEA